MAYCLFPQTKIRPSEIYDDTLDVSLYLDADNLEEDLNYIRSAIRLLHGGDTWQTPPADNLLDAIRGDLDDILGSYVRTFNGRSGDVTLALGDVTTALGAVPVPDTRTITTGDGLQGGGALSGNLSLSVDTSVVRTSREVSTAANSGLQGGGNLSASRSLSVKLKAAGGLSVDSDGLFVDTSGGGGTYLESIENLIVEGTGIGTTYSGVTGAYTISVNSTVVRTTGTQTIGGVKTFDTAVIFSNSANVANTGTMVIAGTLILPLK